jgi:RNA polymerase sigma factor (sigma-70 family)
MGAFASDAVAGYDIGVAKISPGSWRTDQDLEEKVRADIETNFCYFLAVAYRCLQRRCKFASPHEAEDVVQNALVALLRSSSFEYRSEAELRGFVCTCIEHECFKHVAKQKPTTSLDDLDEQLPAGDALPVFVSDVINAPTLNILQTCVAALAPKYREIVVLMLDSGWDDRTLKEIATQLGIAENNAKIRKYRAIRMLKKCLARNGVTEA